MPAAPADNTFERWPAAPRRSVRSTLDGLEILREADEPLAGLLWTAYRFVSLWSEASRAERPSLEDAHAERRWVDAVSAARLPAELETALLSLSVLLRAPLEPFAPAISASMRVLVHHCVAKEWRSAAALLAEAGARVVPGDPGAVYEAGRTARRAGWEREADAWFRHGLSVARRRRNGSEASLFLGSLANGALRRGNLRLAERLHLRSLRAARRASAHDRVAIAMHDLFVVTSHMGETKRAHEWASAALEAYPAAHRNIPILIHDLAYFWMDRGNFAAAYPLMAALLPHLREEDGCYRVKVLGNLARSAAGAGQREAFESAWAGVLRELEARRDSPGWRPALANALREAAQGAVQMGMPDLARWAIAQAEPLALEAEMGQERLVLEAVREAAERAERVSARRRPAAAPIDVVEQEALADRCITVLHERAAAV